MERSKLSIKWLEAFQAVARTGSIRDAGVSLGVSISTVSHHLSCLEEAVGVALIDHARRPMRLTPEGAALLRRVDEALSALRKGLSEVWTEDLAALARSLRIAAIEDFDAEVAPRLAHDLARALPGCDFSFLSRASHEVMALLQAEDADIGVASSSDFKATGLTEAPLLRDPYVLVVPRARADRAEDYLADATGLPFLRYSRRQVMGRRVEAQLRRLGLSLSGRQEFESTMTILSLVAGGQGWTVTTALTYGRGRRLHGQIRALPFPAKGFARQISIYHSAELPQGVRDLFTALARPLVLDHAVAPLVAAEPWLSGQLRLLQ